MRVGQIHPGYEKCAMRDGRGYTSPQMWKRDTKRGKKERALWFGNCSYPFLPYDFSRRVPMGASTRCVLQQGGHRIGLAAAIRRSPAHSANLRDDE